MLSLLDNHALKIYALAITTLGRHTLLLAGWTGTMRVLRKAWVTPEDSTFNKGANVEADHPYVQRVKRAHQNALENAIPFFVIGLMFALTMPTATAASAYFWVFVAARVLHSAFYLWGKQPFRTLMFVVGVLTTIGLACHVLRAVV